MGSLTYFRHHHDMDGTLPSRQAGLPSKKPSRKSPQQPPLLSMANPLRLSPVATLMARDAPDLYPLRTLVMELMTLGAQ